MATVAELETRVTKLENYFNIAIAIAVILGLGGGFIGTELYIVTSKVSALKSQVDNQTNDAMAKISDAGAHQLAKIEAFSNSPDFLLKVRKGLVKENTPYRIQWKDNPYYLDVPNNAVNGKSGSVWVYRDSTHVWNIVPTN